MEGEKNTVVESPLKENNIWQTWRERKEPESPFIQGSDQKNSKNDVPLPENGPPQARSGPPSHSPAQNETPPPENGHGQVWSGRRRDSGLMWR